MLSLLPENLMKEFYVFYYYLNVSKANSPFMILNGVDQRLFRTKKLSGLSTDIERIFEPLKFRLKQSALTPGRQGSGSTKRII